MTEVWLRAALWPGLALTATLVSISVRVATALCEIVVGTIAQLLIGAFAGTALLGTNESWVTIREWVSGSTPRRIVTHANCAVLVVRAK